VFQFETTSNRLECATHHVCLFHVMSDKKMVSVGFEPTSTIVHWNLSPTPWTARAQYPCRPYGYVQINLKCFFVNANDCTYLHDKNDKKFQYNAHNMVLHISVFFAGYLPTLRIPIWAKQSSQMLSSSSVNTGAQ